MFRIIIMIWIIAAAKLIDDMSFMIDDLSVFTQVIVMLLFTLFTPAIYATEFVEELIEFIAGEGCFDA